jgi:hypothetical protein
MKAIETEMSVAADGRAVIELQLPLPVTAGRRRAIVMLDERQADDDRVPARLPVELPVHDFGPWPAGLSLQREQLYGDQGR